MKHRRMRLAPCSSSQATYDQINEFHSLRQSISIIISIIIERWIMLSLAKTARQSARLPVSAWDTLQARFGFRDHHHEHKRCVGAAGWLMIVTWGLCCLGFRVERLDILAVIRDCGGKAFRLAAVQWKGVASICSSVALWYSIQVCRMLLGILAYLVRVLTRRRRCLRCIIFSLSKPSTSLN